MISRYKSREKLGPKDISNIESQKKLGGENKVDSIIYALHFIRLTIIVHE